MQSTMPRHQIIPRPQIKMIGIAKNNRRADCLQIIRRDCLDRADSANWHKDGCGNCAMRGFQPARPGLAIAAFQNKNIFSHFSAYLHQKNRQKNSSPCFAYNSGCQQMLGTTAIDRASVSLNIPEDDGTLIAQEQESYASVILELKDEFSQESAAYLARAVATALGNDTTKNIVIMDVDGNMLFTGDENYSASGMANAQLSVKSEAEKNMINNVRRVILGTNEFDNVEVSPNLVLDFSTQSRTEHTYTPADGQTQGVMSHEDIFSAENTSGTGGVPGTDSNDDESTYVLEDNANSSSTQTEESRDYLPNETITTTDTPSGVINYGASSLTASLIQYNVIREEDVDAQGLLDGVSWEEYKLNNSERTRIELDDTFYAMAANATGISQDNITLVAYSENLFFDAEGSAITATDILQIILIIVILALLAFVVLRSMRGEKHEEEEEELSVETLLQSDVQLEEITGENESEEKRLINKFVEENPEGAANLLRNWLNEDWG